MNVSKYYYNWVTKIFNKERLRRQFVLKFLMLIDKIGDESNASFKKLIEVLTYTRGSIFYFFDDRYPSRLKQRFFI